MSNQKERFNSISPRECRVAKIDLFKKGPYILSERELAKLSQETRDFFNVCLSDSQAGEQGVDLAT